MSEKTMNDICRICLQKDKYSLNLFEDAPVSKKILQDVYACFQVRLTFESVLPYLICSLCAEEVKSANNFRLKCNSFQERFAVFVENCKTSINNQGSPQINKCKDIPGTSDVSEFTVSNNYIAKVINNDIEDDSVLYSKDNLQQSSNNFQCKSCLKIFKSSLNLYRHITLKHQKLKNSHKFGSGIGRKYQCLSCPYSTPHSQTLVNHMRRHDGDKPYVCHCGKKFTQSAGLSAHQKVHSDVSYFTCSKCGKQFKHAFVLKRHQSVHGNGKFSCKICHKVLKTKQTLQEHTHRHYKIRNYNCEDCGNIFATSSELIQHKKTHNTTKNFECNLCGYRTQIKRMLILHLKRHSGDKNHKCELCEVTFYTKGEAARHRRVHTREKPYTCPLCPQRFTYSPSLNKHVLTIHGVQYRWGDVKNKIQSYIKDNIT